MTVVQLLNHSSGLPDNVPAVVGWLHLDKEPALDQTDFLIAQVTGQSYEEHVIEHVLDPLDMTNTLRCGSELRS